MTKSKSSSANAYELLLEAIESGAVPPGSRLIEVELAARFHISRTPIREALKRLEMQGLVSHEPHYGAVVMELSYSALTELYALREVLEGTAARLAAVCATPAEIEILQEMVESDSLLVANSQELARRNKRFHKQLHQSARNRFLSSVLENMRISLVLLSGTTLAAPDRAGRSLQEHQAIVNAIAAHDPDAAEAAARQHILNAFKTRLELRSQSVGSQSAPKVDRSARIAPMNRALPALRTPSDLVPKQVESHSPNPKPSRSKNPPQRGTRPP